MKFSYHRLSLPGSHYNLCVSYFGLAEVWQKFFMFDCVGELFAECICYLYR